MGFAAGLQAGSGAVTRAYDLYEQDQKRKLKEQIAQEAARYGVTEGAYGQGLGENIQQVQGLQQQAIQQAQYQGASEEELAGIEQQYAPSIAELQRRQGLTAPDFSVGSRATNYATAEEARAAATPMRTQGLANVYREAGEVEKADELTGRAMQQEAAGLQLEKARRQAEADARLNSFDAWTAENPGADLATMKEAAKQFKLSQDQVLGVTARMAGLQENELKLWKNEVQNTIKGKTDEELVDIFNKDDRFDPTTNMERKVGKDGSITLTLKRQDGTVVSTYKAPDAATATAYLRKQALEPETLADWLLERQRVQAAIAASGRTGTRAPNYREYTNAAGELVVVDMNTLPRGKDGQPVLPTGLKKAGGGRVPTQAEVTARANLYIQNDQTGELTVEEAVAMAEQDLSGAPAPVSPQRSLVDAAINPQPVAPARTPTSAATPAGQQVLGLYNTVVPPAAQRQPAPPPAQTSQERLRGFYVQQPR